MSHIYGTACQRTWGPRRVWHCLRTGLKLIFLIWFSSTLIWVFCFCSLTLLQSFFTSLTSLITWSLLSLHWQKKDCLLPLTVIITGWMSGPISKKSCLNLLGCLFIAVFPFYYSRLETTFVAKRQQQRFCMHMQVTPLRYCSYCTSFETWSQTKKKQKKNTTPSLSSPNQKLCFSALFNIKSVTKTGWTWWWTFDLERSLLKGSKGFNKCQCWLPEQREAECPLQSDTKGFKSHVEFLPATIVSATQRQY